MKIQELQPNVYNGLVNLFKKRKVAHAYLFEGTVGSGTLEMSLMMTMMFFCQYFTEKGPCLDCGSCRAIQKKCHPDVRVIEPEGRSIKIESIRHLHIANAYKGLEQDKKVYIIQKADKMTPAAANSLLKFLEEPNGHSLVLLLTEDPKRILPTIISRVQRIQFPSLPRGFFETVLENSNSNSRYLPIICSVSDDLEHLSELIEDGIDKKIEIIEKTLQKALFGEVNEAMILATELEMRNKSFVIRLYKSYFRDILKNRRGKSTVWAAHFSIPELEWLQIVDCLEAIEVAERGLNSNQQFILVLETLLISISKCTK